MVLTLRNHPDTAERAWVLYFGTLHFQFSSAPSVGAIAQTAHSCNDHVEFDGISGSQ